MQEGGKEGRGKYERVLGQKGKFIFNLKMGMILK
jgi:hypothetical protein